MAAYDSAPAKRPRVDYDGYSGGPRRSGGAFDEKPAPSPVVHVRNIPNSVLEADLVETVQNYGPVSYVMMWHKKNQALIEFEAIDGAMALVEDTLQRPLYVHGAPVYFNYSTSSKIQRPAFADNKGNNVLMINIMNAQYPITTEVMHTICKQHGEVLRIVIIRRRGVQAMVEFDSVDSARAAKQALQGADIYSGCCTLKIEYAKPTKLNVFKNDMDSFDYTNPNLGKEPFHPLKNRPLLADPHLAPNPTPYGSMPDDSMYQQPAPRPRRGPPMSAGGGGGGEFEYGPDVYGPRGGFDPYGADNMGGGYGDERGAGRSQPAVLMVYNLNMEHMNCQKLFNMLCIYGNVHRIKFLRTKEGTAMVQMKDQESLDRAINNLNGSACFGSKIQMGYSKQSYLQEVPNPHELSDGTMSYMDFTGSRNNRFSTPDAAAKNRILPPNRVLHYFNAPPNYSEEELFKIFLDNGVKEPLKCKQFPSKNERSSTGLLEWDNSGDAMEALIAVNHTTIEHHSSKHPFVFKLCFSSQPIKD